MDPKAIISAINAAKSGGDILTDSAHKITNMSEQRKDGDARRQMETRDQKARIVKENMQIVYDGLGAVVSAGQAVSGIVREQRESTNQAASVCAEIETKKKQVDAEINRLQYELEGNIRASDAAAEHQRVVDKQNFQHQQNEHELRLMELQKKYDATEQTEAHEHERKMLEMQIQHEEKMGEISIQKDQSEAEIRKIDAEIEDRKRKTDMLIMIVEKLLDIYMDCFRLTDLSPENLELLDHHRTALIQLIPQLQALPMKSEG